MSACHFPITDSRDFISDFKELGFKNLKFAERSAEPWKVIEDIEFRTVTLVGNI